MNYRNPLTVIPLLASLGVGCGQFSGADGVAHANLLAAVALQEPAKTDEFRFAATDSGKLLAKMLVLPLSLPLAELPAKNASERSLPVILVSPPSPISDLSLLPVRVAPAELSRPRPGLPAERVPFELAQLQVATPKRPDLPVSGLVPWPIADVRQPTALPILARPSADRASLEDPTLEYTLSSTVNPNLPLRATQTPFVQVFLPNPFENLEAAKAKIELKDDPNRMLGNPPVPKP